jgi:ADP-heptose:LPS heptosyltransferase
MSLPPKTILISPWSRPLRGDKEKLTNPKNYPIERWNEVITKLKEQGFNLVQIGVGDETKLNNIDAYKWGMNLDSLAKLAKESCGFIAIDNFFPHLCNLIGKAGIVIFGQSDPNIFGHKIHDNLLKGREYLREKQFELWESCVYREDCFVSPNDIVVCATRRFS